MLQVRLAACHAARSLLQSCEPEFRDQLLPLLLPQLCFNRWHESDGVRLYSQDTWQKVTQGQGPSWLARCLPQVRPCALLYGCHVRDMHEGIWQAVVANTS